MKELDKVWGTRDQMEVCLDDNGLLRSGQVIRVQLYLHAWPGIFSGLSMSVQMLKREWVAESNGKLQHLFIPIVYFHSYGG